MTRIILLTGLLLATLCCATPVMAGGWLIYHDGPYQGYVLDDETGKPIEGAAVVAEWYVEIYGGPGGPVGEFFDARESVTNAEGWFSVESRTGFFWWPFAELSEPYFTIYKPGYDRYPPVLPMLNVGSTDENHEKADEYKSKYMVGIVKNKHNVIFMRGAKTFNQRKLVIPRFSRVKNFDNIYHCRKLIEDEVKYLNAIERE
jgi:hypothetical protein